MKITTLLLLALLPLPLHAGDPPRSVAGHVRDSATAAPLAGVSVLVKGSGKGAVTDAAGHYAIGGLSGERCTLVISRVSYKTVEVERALQEGVTRVDISLEEVTTAIDEVVVSGRARRDTEGGMTSTIRSMPLVASGVSAARIARTPDRVAAEVMRRVPGVTVIDDRFIIVRGLSQRYNATWINGLPVPSTESDSRAFSFDLIPSSQIDNLIVYKSPSPEIPADFSGGFVQVTTKGLPDENRVEIGHATGFHSATHFHDFRHNPGSATDALGFDAGKRSLPRDFPAHLATVTDPAAITRWTREGFNNDWRVRQSAPAPDQRLSLMIARRVEGEGGRLAGHLTAINYSHASRRVAGIRNARYGIYSAAADRPILLDDYVDNRFSRDVRLGIMHDWTLQPRPSLRLEWKNLLNILGSNRLTERAGVKEMSSMYYREQTEMRYTSRLTYRGQLAGRHEPRPGHSLHWQAGYSHAGKSEPDRRVVTNQAGIGSLEDIPAVTTINDNITRYFHRLRDHALSLALDYRRPLPLPLAAALKAGLHGEYTTRVYTPREFIYRHDNLPYEERQQYLKLPYREMMDERYLGAGKVYIDEITRETSAYSARVWHAAGYAAVEIPWGRLTLYTGARLESHRSTLSRDRADAPGLTLMTRDRVNDLNLLPSINASYRFSGKHLLKLAYGRSLNRPELREISPAVYFDFDLFSEIGGNDKLTMASIDNLDARYEFYPAFGESLSVGLFYKHFKNPIEWTFVDMGGSLRYNYENADRATNWGVEIDARRKLDFTGLAGLTAVLNVALIASNVRFKPGEIVLEPDRAMQGQSPYVINAGLFYQSRAGGLHLSLLYNRIGKRIVGLGKSNSIQPDINTLIPDSYEMPRDALDASIRARVGRRLEIQCALKDILPGPVLYKQFPRFEKNGVIHRREQVTRSYNPGCSFSAGITLKID
jgi:outer membrane receptor protein involved in Fe transport